jgi:hypothetical protein
VYSGYGATYVETGGNKYAFYLKPKVVTFASQTEAALVRAPFTFCNYFVEFDMNTINQLRQGSPPTENLGSWLVHL